MHAAFVLPRFYPYRGGYENSMLAIARCLMSRGHRVSVFTTVADDLESLWLPGFKAFAAEDFSTDGVQVRRFPICYQKWRRRATRIAGLAPSWRLKAQFTRPGFRVPGLAEALRACDADVYHIGPLPYSSLMYAGLQAAEHRQVPVVATPCVHLGEAGTDAVVRHYLQTHQIELLRHSDRILCMTDVEREHLLALGIAPGTLLTVGLGIDMQEATGGDAGIIRRQYGIDGPIVLHLGMRAYEKGSVTLIEAMKLLWAAGSQAWLVMAGPSMSKFDEYLACQKPMPRLLCLPAFADEDKRNLLACATVVAQPSRVESLGLIMLEAWANGKPVVAADIEVSRKLVSARGAGVVTPFGDAVSLAAVLGRLVGDLALCAEMGKRARTAAQDYDGRKGIWRRNAEVIEAVAGERKRRNAMRRS